MKGSAKNSTTSLSAMELEKFLSVAQAAEFLSLSEDTVLRRYGGLFRHLSPRRRGIKVRDLLAATDAANAAA
jgi:hypothetical protein